MNDFTGTILIFAGLIMYTMFRNVDRNQLYVVLFALAIYIVIAFIDHYTFIPKDVYDLIFIILFLCLFCMSLFSFLSVLNFEQKPILSYIAFLLLVIGIAYYYTILTVN